MRKSIRLAGRTFGKLLGDLKMKEENRIRQRTWAVIMLSMTLFFGFETRTCPHPPCSFSISPPSDSYPGSGIVSAQVNVTTSSGCDWTAISNDSWITITSGSSGSGNGVVTFSVSANPSSSSRTGTITIADQIFTVIQAGVNVPFISYIAPTSGPLTGGTAITIQGRGFQMGASVTIGGKSATVTSVTNNEITATTGMASTPGTYDVIVTNPGGESAVLHHAFTYRPVTEEEELFVPVVVSAAGLNGSFFTSEMTLTNRGSGDATVDFTYTSSNGTGSGTATDNLGPGQQKVVPDAINYLGIVGDSDSHLGEPGRDIEGYLFRPVFLRRRRSHSPDHHGGS